MGSEKFRDKLYFCALSALKENDIKEMQLSNNSIQFTFYLNKVKT